MSFFPSIKRYYMQPPFLLFYCRLSENPGGYVYQKACVR